MKKITIFLMLIICLAVLFPVRISAKNNFDDNSVYILADNKATTSSTTSEYIAKSDVEKIVGTNSAICQEGSSLKAF